MTTTPRRRVLRPLRPVTEDPQRQQKLAAKREQLHKTTVAD